MRDACHTLADAANQYIQSMVPSQVELTAIQELTFTTLKFEAQQGTKLGDYAVAYKQNNHQDKWQSAYNTLRINNSTIKDCYHADTYQYSYWLYGEDKIYRQKLKTKTAT
jgi:hypothetical protein